MMEAKEAIIPTGLGVSKEGAALAPVSDIKKVLFIRGGAVGDFVLTVPLLRALRKAHPGASLEILGYPEIASLAMACGLADRIHRVDAPGVAPLFSESGSFPPEQAAWFGGFGAVVCVWPDRDGVMRRRLGQVCAGRVVHIDPMPRESSSVHAVDYANAQMAAHGYGLLDVAPMLTPGRAEAEWAEGLWRTRGLVGERTLGVHPGSGSRRKNWPADRFAAVMGRWIAEGGKVLMTEGPSDEEAAGAVLSRMAGRGVVCLRHEPLPRVAAALARCAAYVGNDSGLTHLAAALGVPTVAVFGPTDSGLWGPRGARVKVVEGGQGFAEASAEAVLRALDSVTG